ncbi:unannotated protein [freshwater metagenome]|uniref:Unannotated protein n=1 Tax=freshwater metagenome TaxID=449393 RepID=A0A6J6V9G8_9ZZZZ
MYLEDTGAKKALSLKSLASSTKPCVAASNSITSNDPGPFATKSLQDWQTPHGVGVGPLSQFKDLAIIRALDVLPQPLGPLNKYA